VEKLSFSFGPALIGAALGAAGYVAAAGTAQPESARAAIYACMTIVPVLSTGGGALLLRRYRIGGVRES
jgi:Na+/melibiose symporter-like transporter